jgi:hypothetical protein
MPVALRSSRHASAEPEVALDQVGDRALRVAAAAAEVLEVDLVVLDPADGEGELDLERADVRVDLVRVAEIGHESLPRISFRLFT